MAAPSGLALAAIVMAQWYAATGRSLARAAQASLRGLRPAGDGGAGAEARRIPASSAGPGGGPS
jgi:hypothetical protein